MEIKINRKSKTVREKLREWLKSAQPSDAKAWVYHDPNVSLRSKQTIVCELVRHSLHYKGYRAKVKFEPMPEEQAREMNLKHEKGYEPALLILLQKEKKS